MSRTEAKDERDIASVRFFRHAKPASLKMISGLKSTGKITCSGDEAQISARKKAVFSSSVFRYACIRESYLTLPNCQDLYGNRLTLPVHNRDSRTASILSAGAMASTKSLQYATLDVFTNEPFKGNQLAIVHLPTTSQLAQSAKQAIAREFNFSETVFLHGGDSGSSERRLEIFTSKEELPFAGHPVIGAICHVCRSSDPPLGATTLKIKAGNLVGRYEEGTGLAEAEIPHDVRLHQVKVHAKAFLASQPRISSSAGTNSVFPAVSIVKGMTFILTEMENLETLGILLAGAQRIDRESIKLDDGWEPSFMAPYYYVIVQRTTEVIKVRSRLIEPSIGEDPCTGSAASTLAAYLSLRDGELGETYVYVIEQGVEVGRAGEIHVKVTLDETAKAVKKVILVGGAVLVSKGVLYIP